MATNTIQPVRYSTSDVWSGNYPISGLKPPYLLKNVGGYSNTIYLFYEVPQDMEYTGASYSIQFNIENNNNIDYSFSCESLLESNTSTITAKSQSTNVSAQSSRPLSISSNNASTSYKSTGYLRLKIKGNYPIVSSNNFIYLQNIPTITVTYTVPKLSLRAEPSNQNINKEITIYFDNNFNNKVNYTLNANGKAIATGSNEQNEFFEYLSYKTIDCDPNWFNTAKESGSDLTVTVTGQEDGGYSRTAQQTSFTVTMPRLGVTLTPPTSSGSGKYLTIKFSERSGHPIYVTIAGPKSTLFERARVDNSDTYKWDSKNETCQIRTPDSWFIYEEGDSIECTVLVEDDTWYRPVTKNFTLNASSVVLPQIYSVTLSADNSDWIALDANDGYVAGYSKVKIDVMLLRGISNTSSVSITYNGNTLTLPGKSDSNRTEYYITTTPQAINSATTYKVTVTDAGKRTDTYTATVSDGEITKPQNISLAFDPSSSVEAGNTIYLAPANYYGKYRYTVIFGDKTLASDNNLTQQAEISTSYNWFDNVSSATLPVTINVWDTLNRKATRQYTITRPAAIISNITASNVADPRMPYGYSYVANYSKVYVTCEIEWFAEADTVTISGGSAQNVPMEYNPESEKYEVTTPVITGDITFTIAATDKAKNITRKTVQVTNVTRLSEISIGFNPSSVEAGKTTTITVNNFIGAYSYSFKSENTIFQSPSGSNISASSFTLTVPASWFDDYAEKRRQITIVIKDSLAREKTAAFYVSLPDPKVELSAQNVTVGETLSIAFIGRAGRTVSYELTAKDTEIVLDSGTTNSDVPVTIQCSKQKYVLGGIQDKSYKVVVTASYNGELKTAEFTFALPELKAYASTNTIQTYGPLVLNFTGQSGESVYCDFYYQSQKLGTSFGPYSGTNATIEVPQYFDEANITNSQNLPVTIKVYDGYQRSFTVTGITITAHPSMAPELLACTYQERNINPYIDSLTISRDGSTLNVDAYERYLDWQFKCEVSDGTNTATTNIGTFVRPKTGLFAMLPEKVVAGVNENAEFHVISVGAVGTVTYEWLVSVDGESWEEITPSEDPSTLIVEATDTKLGWLFRCIVSDGNEIVTTNDSYFVRTSNDFFTWMPAKVEAQIGGRAEFHVTVENAAGDVSYQWFRSPDNGRTWDEVPYMLLEFARVSGITKLNISQEYLLHTNARLKSATLKYNSITIPLNMNIDHEAKTCEITTPNPVLDGDNAYTITVVDERGMSKSTTMVWEGGAVVYPYYVPLITIDNITRCDSNKNPTTIGDYCLMTVSYNLSEIYTPDALEVPNLPINRGELYVTTQGYANAKVLGLSYDFYTHKYTKDYQGTVEFFFPADIEHTFQIQVTLVDYFKKVTKTVTLPTAEVIMDFLHGGNGVAIGKISEHSKMFEVNPTWELKASIKLSNGTLVDLATVINQLLNGQ